jgi:hypothetical protein
VVSDGSKNESPADGRYSASEGHPVFWVRNEDQPNDPEGHLFLRSPDGFWLAQVRRDGCFELTRSHNVPLAEQPDEEDIDFLHVCDYDAMLERLDAMRRAAQDHFDQVWP